MILFAYLLVILVAATAGWFIVEFAKLPSPPPLDRCCQNYCYSCPFYEARGL